MKRIVCIGDSNTYGYDPRSFLGDRYPKNVRWTGLLNAAGYEVINLGMNGAGIPSDLSYLAGVLKECEPYDLIIVMLGSNDLLNGLSAEAAAKDMKGFLHALKQETGAAILLAAPVPFVQGEWVSGESVINASKELIPAYRKTAEEEGTFFADLSSRKVKLAFDGVHYLPEGHAAVAEGMKEAVSAVLGTEPAK